MVPLVLLVMRESPAAVGLRRYGATEDEGPPPPREANPAVIAVRTLARAAKHRDFWLLAGTFFVCGASTNGLIGTHLIPACMDHGIPEVRAAKLLATMGIFDLVGTTLSGWLTDRWDSRRLLFTYYALRGLSLIFLPDALREAGPGLNAFTVFYGLDWIATVPPTVRLATNTFGQRDAPIVFGWIFAAHQVGAGVAALGAPSWATTARRSSPPAPCACSRRSSRSRWGAARGRRRPGRWPRPSRSEVYSSSSSGGAPPGRPSCCSPHCAIRFITVLFAMSSSFTTAARFPLWRRSESRIASRSIASSVRPRR